MRALRRLIHRLCKYMSPEDTQRLSACLKEAAEILYRYTPSANQNTFSAIEKTLRIHWLEKIGPQLAFFLSLKQQALIKEESET